MGRSYNHHQVDLDVQHALTTLACILHPTAEIPDNADGTTNLTTIGNATAVRRTTVIINLDTRVFLESANLQNRGRHLTTLVRYLQRQPHQRQNHARRKLQLKLLRVYEHRDQVSVQMTRLRAPVVTT